MPVQAGPGRATVATAFAAALGLLGLGLTSDLAGALLTLPAAAVALALGLRDLLLTPVLRADAGGLELVQGLSRRRLDWADVVSLRTVTDRRAVLLEVELADDDVVLLSRTRLGRDPRDVLDELRALRS